MKSRKREDWTLLKNSGFSDSEITALCLTPLLLQTDSVLANKDEPKPREFSIQTNVIEGFDSIKDFLDDTMGLCFLVLQKFSDPSDNKQGYAYFLVDLDPSEEDTFLSVKLISIMNIKIDVEIHVKKNKTVELTGKKGSLFDSLDEKRQKEFIGYGLAHIVGAVDYIKEAVESSKHPIEIYEKNPPKGSKGHKPHIKSDRKPWMRGDLVSVVFLDKLPSPRDYERKPHKGGSHASPRHHQRKGHYRIMKSERFKNHPDFGKPKWISSYWVGDDTKIIGGVTYKVLHSKKKVDK